MSEVQIVDIKGLLEHITSTPFQVRFQQLKETHSQK